MTKKLLLKIIQIAPNLLKITAN